MGTGDSGSGKPWRIGLLVVHGMGQQQRHQQLAELATAIATELSPPNSTGVVPEVEFYSHRGHTQRKAVIRMPLCGEGRATELHIMELYWAHLVRGGTNLLKVLFWMGWAIYRELFPEGSGTKIEGSFVRFVWLGLVILETFVLVALITVGMAWFGWLAATELFWQLHALSLPPGSERQLEVLARHPYLAHGIGEWVLTQWLPFVVFSVAIRAAYVLVSQAAPSKQAVAERRAPGSASPGGPPNRAPAYWLGIPLVTTLLTGWGWSVALHDTWESSGLPMGFSLLPWLATSAILALLSFGLPARLVKNTGQRQYGWQPWVFIWRSVIVLALSLPVHLLALHQVVIAKMMAGVCWLFTPFTNAVLELTQFLEARTAAAFGTPLAAQALRANDTALRPLADSGLAWWMLLLLLCFLGLCLGVAVSRMVQRSGIPSALWLIAFAVAAVASAVVCLLYAGGMAAALTCLTVMLVTYSFLKLLLVDYFGDIAIFITQHETSSTFALRQRVLTEARHRLEYLFGVEIEDGSNTVRALPADETFDRVGVIAHSLGCPVTYDALCSYFSALEARPQAAPELAAARGRFAFYATYGCILEIVKFYFGRRAGSVSLYNRLEALGLRTFCNPAGAPVEQMPCAEWVNIRSVMDPFTWPGLVSFGDGIRTEQAHTIVWPVYAHVAYMGDAYVRWLLGDTIRRRACPASEAAAAES
jgi:hypothetical protein